MWDILRSFSIAVLLGGFTVASAQLSPETRADAYLLQAEQAIRDGDLDRARTVIQNIRNLQEQHELDLPNEFHFRYAKAASSLDLPDQALESVVKYLTVSGRKGQHYLEALELKNKVQRAVSCKGWDIDGYFKTATLEEVTACLDTGVDLEERNYAGYMPLHRAAKETENPDIIKALINAGADPNAQDGDKWTPLHYAARYNENPDVFKVLIAAGVYLHVHTSDGKTPLDLATERSSANKSAIIKILRDAIARKKEKK